MGVCVPTEKTIDACMHNVDLGACMMALPLHTVARTVATCMHDHRQHHELTNSIDAVHAAINRLDWLVGWLAGWPCAD